MGDFEEFVRDIIDLISHEEQNRLYEMELWIMNSEGVWVLDDRCVLFKISPQEGACEIPVPKRSDDTYYIL